jgi:hypothetical protein
MLSGAEPKPHYALVPFGGQHATPTADLVALHAELLAESPIAKLGPRFMAEFYYRELPASGAIVGEVAYVDGKAAGFIVSTPDPAGFMRKALRRNWPLIAWTVARSVLSRPRSLGAVLEAMALLAGGGGRTASAAGQAELLSFGVREGYRDFRFVRDSGIRISHDLLHSALKRLYAEDARSVRAMVARSNLPTQMFYVAQGWRRVEMPNINREAAVEFVHVRNQRTPIGEGVSPRPGVVQGDLGNVFTR